MFEFCLHTTCSVRVVDTLGEPVEKNVQEYIKILCNFQNQFAQTNSALIWLATAQFRKRQGRTVYVSKVWVIDASPVFYMVSIRNAVGPRQSEAKVAMPCPSESLGLKFQSTRTAPPTTIIGAWSLV